MNHKTAIILVLSLTTAVLVLDTVGPLVQGCGQLIAMTIFRHFGVI